MTAFEPFGAWRANASWQLLVELTKDLPQSPEVVTRLYPVEFSQLAKKLEEDLAGDFDYALLLGQNEKASGLELERFALNIGRERSGSNSEFDLAPHGPAAYRSELPLEEWVEGIRRTGTPASISNYAGDYCCNAVYYHCSHLCRRNEISTQSVFIHVPITPQQAAEQPEHQGPTLETSRGVTALRYLLDQLVQRGPRPKMTAS